MSRNNKEEQDSYYFYKIPKSEKSTTKSKRGSSSLMGFLPSMLKPKKPKTVFIGVIDCSGSMRTAWPSVIKEYNSMVSGLPVDVEKHTIIFSSKARIIPDNTLTSKMCKGSTEIFLGMKEVDLILKRTPKNSFVKVCFVSDGADNNPKTLHQRLKKLTGFQGKNLTFMCVGVGAKFPTSTSIFLRQKFHKGDPTVPSIFLIEHLSGKAFFNKFQTLKDYCKNKKKVVVEPSHRPCPWLKPSKYATEESWIVSKKPSIKIGGEVVVFNPADFCVEAVVEIFRDWSQRLQLGALNKDIGLRDAIGYAEMTLQEMNLILHFVEQRYGMNLLERNLDIEDGEVPTFLEKVRRFQTNMASERVVGYVEAVEEIVLGKDLSKMNEFEAAKIIGLGTIVGKAQQRALSLKVLTKEVLKTHIEEFIEVAERLRSQAVHNSTNQQNSLERFISDPSLASGLRKLQSPIELLRLFPLEGLAIKAKRNEGHLKNPWMVSVDYYHPEKHTIQTPDFDFANHRLIPKNSKGIYNAVCPLIPKSKSYLWELYNTNLVKYVISYYTTKQLDGPVDEAWMALLVDIFIRANKQGDFALAETIIDTIDSMKDSEDLKELLEMIKRSDRSLSVRIKSVKEYYVLLYYYGSRVVGKGPEFAQKRQQICNDIWLAYFALRAQTTKISDLVSQEWCQNVLNWLLEKYNSEYLASKFFYCKEMVRYFKKDAFQEIDELVKSDKKFANQKLTVNLSGLKKDSNESISFSFVQKLTKNILEGGNDSQSYLSPSELVLYLGNAINHKQETLTKGLLLRLEKCTEIIQGQLKEEEFEKASKKKITYRLTEILRHKYYDQFKEDHFGVLPKSWDEIIRECGAKNISTDGLQYDAEIGMVTNACMSDNCPHQYVVKDKKQLRNHFGGWRRACPRAFLLFVAQNSMLGASPEVVYGKFLEEKGLASLDGFGVPKGRVIKYIKYLQEKYRNLRSN